MHVVESMDRGGLERVVCDLAQEQLRAGHQVSIVCLFNGGLLAGEAQAAGADVTVIGKGTGLDLPALMRLRRVLKADNADIIHTHNATAHYHVAVVVARSRRVVLVNTRHGMGGSRKSDRRERFFSFALGRTAAVAAVCQAAAKRMVADRIVPAGLVRVVPNGICVREFAGRDTRDARRQMAVPDDGLVIGTVGRLNWAKDHAFLLHAFREFPWKSLNAFLVIIGEGQEHETLKRLAAELELEERVKFLGDRADVAYLLPGMDIFVLSSRTEGYSVALLEACAAGMAIVATDVGGNREIVQNQVTGLLVEHGNLASFSNALLRLAQSGVLREQLGSAAQTWAAANASLESMADRYESLYAECRATTARGRDQAQMVPRSN